MTYTQFMPASRKDMVARMYVMFFTGSMAPDWYNTAWNSRTHYMWARLTWYNSSITKSTVGKWMTISHGVWYTDLIVGCESNQSALSHSKFNTSKLQLPVNSKWVACIYQVLPSYLIQLDLQRVSGLCCICQDVSCFSMTREWVTLLIDGICVISHVMIKRMYMTMFSFCWAIW